MSKLVYVVEDDSYIRADLVDILIAEGYHVQSYVNGRLALDALHIASQLPQLIVLDLMMPVMDGYTFCAEVGKVAAFEGVPIIVISADRQAERILTCPSLFSFMRKPLDLDAFLGTIAKALAR